MVILLPGQCALHDRGPTRRAIFWSHIKNFLLFFFTEMDFEIYRNSFEREVTIVDGNLYIVATTFYSIH